MYTPHATPTPHPALLDQLPVIPFPEGTDHVTVMKDVKALWAYTTTLQNLQTEKEVRAVFAKYPAAQTTLEPAQALQRELRVLLDQPLPAGNSAPEPDFADLFAPPAPAPAAPAPVPTPAPVTPTPVPTPAPVASTEPEAAPAEPEAVPDEAQDSLDEGDTEASEESGEDGDVDVSEDDGDTEDEGDPEDSDPDSGTPAATPPVSAAPAAPLPPLPRTVSWGDGLLGTGLISGLARTLARGDLVQVVIARVSDEDLMVTVLPRRIDGEPDTLNTDMNVRGTPAELDAGLLEAVPTYEQVRLTARDVAAELLERTRAKAAEAKKTPAKAAPPAKTSGAAGAKPTPKPGAKPTQGTVTFTLGNTDLTPADVRVHVSGKGDPVTGKLADLTSIKLDPGTYSAEFAASGFESGKASVTVTAGKTETVKVNLKALAAAPLF